MSGAHDERPNKTTVLESELHALSKIEAPAAGCSSVAAAPVAATGLAAARHVSHRQRHGHSSVHLFGLGAERTVLFRRRWDGHGVRVRRGRAFFPPALLLAARSRRVVGRHGRQEVEERRRRPVGLLVFGHARVPLTSHAARRGAAEPATRSHPASRRCARNLERSRRQFMAARRHAVLHVLVFHRRRSRRLIRRCRRNACSSASSRPRSSRRPPGTS